jgi:hypothetical protein
MAQSVILNIPVWYKPTFAVMGSCDEEEYFIFWYQQFNTGYFTHKLPNSRKCAILLL